MQRAEEIISGFDAKPQSKSQNVSTWIQRCPLIGPKAPWLVERTDLVEQLSK